MCWKSLSWAWLLAFAAQISTFTRLRPGPCPRPVFLCNVLLFYQCTSKLAFLRHLHRSSATQSFADLLDSYKSIGFCQDNPSIQASCLQSHITGLGQRRNGKRSTVPHTSCYLHPCKPSPSCQCCIPSLFRFSRGSLELFSHTNQALQPVWSHSTWSFWWQYMLKYVLLTGVWLYFVLQIVKDTSENKLQKPAFAPLPRLHKSESSILTIYILQSEIS